jgi:hypothetical protein
MSLVRRSDDDHNLCLHCRAPVPYLTTGWLVTEIVSH